MFPSPRDEMRNSKLCVTVELPACPPNSTANVHCYVYIQFSWTTEVLSNSTNGSSCLPGLLRVIEGELKTTTFFLSSSNLPHLYLIYISHKTKSYPNTYHSSASFKKSCLSKFARTAKLGLQSNIQA